MIFNNYGNVDDSAVEFRAYTNNSMYKSILENSESVTQRGSSRNTSRGAESFSQSRELQSLREQQRVSVTSFT